MLVNLLGQLNVDNMEANMNGLTYEQDIRYTDPTATRGREIAFKGGWTDAVNGKTYNADTMKSLTWASLGNRLGTLFGQTSKALVEEMYDWCVRQQAAAREER